MISNKISSNSSSTFAVPPYNNNIANNVGDRQIKQIYPDNLPQANTIFNNKEEIKTKERPANPTMPYFSEKQSSNSGRRLVSGGKLRSNTVICHQKPQSVPFDTGLDAEFLNLFAKD